MKWVLALLMAGVSLQAMAADAPAQGNSYGPIIFLVLIVAFMYFMVWRPQQKKAKEHRALINAVSKGEEIMTSSGILGRVAVVHDQYIELEVSPNVSMTIQKSAIVSVLPKGTLNAFK